MREHIVNVQPFLQPGQVLRLVQIVLFAEVAQFEPVFVIPVLQELIRSRPGQDIDVVDIRLLRHSFIGGNEVFVDFLPQIVVSPVPSVDIDLDHLVILVQDILPLRQAAGDNVPQPRRVGIAVGRPQKQAFISRIIPGRERIECELIRAPGFPGIQGYALLAVDPGAVPGAGHRSRLADFLFSVPVEILNMNRIFISFRIVRYAARSFHQHTCLFAEQVFIVGNQGYNCRLRRVIDKIGSPGNRRGNRVLPESLHPQRRGLLQLQPVSRERFALFCRSLPVRGVIQLRPVFAPGFHRHAALIKSCRTKASASFFFPRVAFSKKPYSVPPVGRP